MLPKSLPYWMETYTGIVIPYYIPTVSSQLNYETYTQQRNSYIDLLSSRIQLRDIAHSLSLQCRFYGHCNHHWSVAAHSILVYDCVQQYCSTQIAMEDKSLCDILPLALFHDAHETYLNDNIRPYKQFLKQYLIDSCADIQDTHAYLSQVFDEALHSAFSLHTNRFGYQLIKEADNIILRLEALLLMSSQGRDWTPLQTEFIPQDFVPQILKIMEYNPSQIEDRFMKLASVYV